jgi:truncated hemoglobin YjbI
MERGPELFARIGEQKLREVITDFYSRVFGDIMIGFLFEGKNRQHLIDREYEFTANFLGADVKYTGRPMRTLRDHAVDPDVEKVWIDHTLALRAQITPDKGSECKDTAVSAAPRLPASESSGSPPPATDVRIKLGKKR